MKINNISYKIIPTSVYNAISHNYKKSFTKFVKDYNIIKIIYNKKYDE